MAKKEIILKELTALAFQVSKLFCYLCYMKVKKVTVQSVEQMNL
ncbi:MAG: hypothetical protein OXK80_04300 [Bdellovibrionales bacterium]|nr:hypothetical protein [Bdellovibrionales bacterium]